MTLIVNICALHTTLLSLWAWLWILLQVLLLGLTKTVNALYSLTWCSDKNNWAIAILLSRPQWPINSGLKVHMRLLWKRCFAKAIPKYSKPFLKPFNNVSFPIIFLSSLLVKGICWQESKYLCNPNKMSNGSLQLQVEYSIVYCYT